MADHLGGALCRVHRAPGGHLHGTGHRSKSRRRRTVGHHHPLHRNRQALVRADAEAGNHHPLLGGGRTGGDGRTTGHRGEPLRRSLRRTHLEPVDRPLPSGRRLRTHTPHPPMDCTAPRFAGHHRPHLPDRRMGFPHRASGRTHRPHAHRLALHELLALPRHQ